MKHVIFLFLLNVLRSNIVFAQVNDDECFAAAFTKGAESCSGFKNDIFLCNLNVDIAPESDDGTSTVILSGEMELKEDFDEEYEVVLNVWKDAGTGKTYMYNIEGNLCDSLKRNDTPWRPLVEALQTSNCPVAKGLYKVDNLKMNLDFAKNVMTREFCGDYMVEISIGKELSEDKISCYEIGIEVMEVSCD